MADVTPSSTGEGTAVYQKSGCADCHAIGGQGDKTGPDLTHVGATRDVAYLTAYIRNPASKNPKATMSAYPEKMIAAKDLEALAAYLASLK